MQPCATFVRDDINPSETLTWQVLEGHTEPVFTVFELSDSRSPFSLNVAMYRKNMHGKSKRCGTH